VNLTVFSVSPLFNGGVTAQKWMYQPAGRIQRTGSSDISLRWEKPSQKRSIRFTRTRCQAWECTYKAQNCLQCICKVSKWFIFQLHHQSWTHYLSSHYQYSSKV